MKKVIINIILFCLLLIGCRSKEKSYKIDENLLNKFPSSIQGVIKEVNPDIVTMKYLINNSDKYKTELGSDRNDFFVIVKGTVTDIKKTNYSNEDLSILKNEDMASLLKNTISYSYSIDKNNTPLEDSITIGEQEPNIDTDKEYYFFVTVNKYGNEYSYNIIDYFNLN